jgi:hypothetical protein
LECAISVVILHFRVVYKLMRKQDRIILLKQEFSSRRFSELTVQCSAPSSIVGMTIPSMIGLYGV